MEERLNEESESTDRQNPERERRIENLSRGCIIPESELPNWVRVHHECECGRSVWDLDLAYSFKFPKKLR